MFEKIKSRDVMDACDECEDEARRIFDQKLLESIGCLELYDEIKESLLSMQHTRHCVK